MLLFVCSFLRALPPGGLVSPGEPFALHRTLEAAHVVCRAPAGNRGRVLVLRDDRVALATADPPTTHAIAPEAVLNVDDEGYRPPEAVPAAGGYVLRRAPATSRKAAKGAAGGLEVLLIFRRGAWDLPKGKLDPGETPEGAAHREVVEEVGLKARRLRVLGPLGRTLHGYPFPKRRAYAVKTTHWFAMALDGAPRLRPQADEGIEAVAWVPWAEAGARLGFESLRRHHAAQDPAALAALLDAPA